ncbi:FecR family protein [Aquimarina sediminis]|uniref:FecR family protein n=1 Tax=Aquimarina sediminis TaxID=2070536 RepID=UPI000CA04EB5|nr:FecR family protein [Aquimarina sediminis]
MERLIIKFITNSISKEELDKLEEWLTKTENVKTFNEYVKLNYAIDFKMHQFDLLKAKSLLLNRIEKDKRNSSKQRFLDIIKYAAIVVVFLGLGLFAKMILVDKQNRRVDNSQLIVEEKNIILRLENGESRIIKREENLNLISSNGKVLAEQNGNQLNYQSGVVSDSIMYNELLIPNGRQFELILSDGSKIHLNAGSVFKYPVHFVKGDARQVFLSGEAYFDVASDQERPFIVNTKEIGIQVVGTKFNVVSYSQDFSSPHVVLVEGSVGLFKKGNKFNGKKDRMLKPGYRGEWKRENEDFSIQKVNVEEYLSWRNGELIFRHRSFKDIVNTLERHYNVEIINKNKKLEKELFNASFKKESIHNILIYFQDVLGIEYSISDNKIVIK